MSGVPKGNAGQSPNERCTFRGIPAWQYRTLRAHEGNSPIRKSGELTQIMEMM